MKYAQLLRNQWDRTAAWVAAGGGALALLLGYLGISRTPYTPEQLPYLISGGAFGLFLLGVAAVLWLTADLRDEWRKLDEMGTAIDQLLEAQTARAEREVEAREAEDRVDADRMRAAQVPMTRDAPTTELAAVPARRAARTGATRTRRAVG